MPILDTNFLIALRATEEAAVALLDELAGQPLIVPDVVAAEFLTDLAKAEDRDTALTALEQDFMLTYADRDWVLAAAELRAELRRRKATIRRADHWIATWSRLLSTPVVTRNTKDFRSFGVKTVAW